MTVQRRIQTSEVGGVTVVGFIDHKILDAANIQELGEELFRLVEQDGYKNILLDFSNVAWISSTGVGLILTAFHLVRDNGGRLKLCCLQKRVLSILYVTRLHILCEVHATRQFCLNILLIGHCAIRRRLSSSLRTLNSPFNRAADAVWFPLGTARDRIGELQRRRVPMEGRWPCRCRASLAYRGARGRAPSKRGEALTARVRWIWV